MHLLMHRVHRRALAGPASAGGPGPTNPRMHPAQLTSGAAQVAAEVVAVVVIAGLVLSTALLGAIGARDCMGESAEGGGVRAQCSVLGAAA